MLLRNIDSPKPCNGTHLDVQLLLLYAIKAIVLIGIERKVYVLIYSNVMSIITINIAFELKQL